MYDLNFLSNGSYSLKDFSIKNKNIHIYFKDIKEHLIEHIQQFNYIVGCVAWLTDEDIMYELSKKTSICFIIQKENFNKIDYSISGGWKQTYIEKYKIFDHMIPFVPKQLPNP